MSDGECEPSRVVHQGSIDAYPALAEPCGPQDVVHPQPSFEVHDLEDQTEITFKDFIDVDG
jgi:hypothetical protein